MHQRAWLGAITLVGAGLVVLGALTRGYASSVFANLGTTVLLAIPLLLMERALERRLARATEQTDRAIDDLGGRVVDVQESLAEVSDRLREAADETARRVAEQRARDGADLVAPARAISDEPTYLSVMGAMEAAERARAIARHRNRGGLSVHVSLSCIDRGFSVTVTRRSNATHLAPVVAHQLLLSVTPTGEGQARSSCTVWWEPDWSVQECFVEVDRSLRRELGAGAPSVPPDVVLEQLAWGLAVALRRRAALGAGARERWALRAVIAPGWLVTTEGLEHVERGIVAPMHHLMDAGAEPPRDAVDPDVVEQLSLVWHEARRLVGA
ncbi:hypothetical protein [Vallicoccus soli]|uniref:Uncharacterized protein n=1 Tax=Vallicoccus soli TaxID=2339232 RepID=A0A3A3YZY8_9ACTN|nr:hypothetical protein [Vallicoccus soli]RJK94752.1 hypothetical protein D5H78_13010 [Vallicoccus soli]